MNMPFTKKEFDVASSACKSRSAPGLDGISYEVIRDFSAPILGFVLELFNFGGLDVYLCDFYP